MSGGTAITRQEAGQYLKDHDGYLILTHKRPDGDAVGCAVALCLALRRLGKTAWVLRNPDATTLFAPYWGDTVAPEGYVPQTVVSVDLASEGLFFDEEVCWRGKVDLCIDHHGSNESYAKYSCVEPDKAACGEILYHIIKEWFPVEGDIALLLYVAVATDTGCFLYNNTTPHTHRVAADLMETGIDAIWVNKRHFRTKSVTRLRVESRLIETMDLYDEGTIALGAISLADVSELGAREEDLEDIAGFIGQLEGVHTSVTIRELKPDECKLSVRTGADLNASAVCAKLGGGGHANAAGCTVFGSVDDAKREIMGAIRAVQEER